MTEAERQNREYEDAISRLQAAVPSPTAEEIAEACRWNAANTQAPNLFDDDNDESTLWERILRLLG